MKLMMRTTPRKSKPASSSNIEIIGSTIGMAWKHSATIGGPISTSNHWYTCRWTSPSTKASCETWSEAGGQAWWGNASTRRITLRHNLKMFALFHQKKRGIKSWLRARICPKKYQRMCFEINFKLSMKSFSLREMKKGFNSNNWCWIELMLMKWKNNIPDNLTPAKYLKLILKPVTRSQKPKTVLVFLLV